MALYLNTALDGELGSTTRQFLDGAEYRLTVFWRSEVIRVPFQFSNSPPPLIFGSPGIWVVDLALADGTLLFAGQIARHGVNMLGPWRGNPRFPGQGYGQLVAWDLSGGAQDPGRDDLDPGTPRRLMYRTAAEATA